MCGLAGVLYKAPTRHGQIGETLTNLLTVLGSRGVDGTGVAIYDPLPAGQLVARVMLGGDQPSKQAERVVAGASKVAPVLDSRVQADSLRLVVAADGVDGAATKLAGAIEESAPGVSVFSLGHAMQVIKDEGDARRLDDKYGIAEFGGTHGIGHTRMATESRVDISHSHPFWARPFPDIAVVHNGQITNYHKLRRQYEMQGWQFDTENDSEIIALYLAHKMAGGAGMEEAMRASAEDLDGTFTYLVSTSQGIGYARDMFATKPLVVTEKDELVAFASEETALCQTFGADRLDTWEPAAKEVRVWLR
jgi:glutamate synthase domain-containing protein 1